MRSGHRSLISVWLILALWLAPLQARTRKGDGLIEKARALELKDTTLDMEAALKLAEEALATDRADLSYQLEVAKLRACAAQYHVYEGQVLRDQGKIKEAIAEFERAKALDPASIVAPQELQRTRDLVNEIRRNPSVNVDELLLRPLPRKNKRDEAQFSSATQVPRIDAEHNKPLPSIKVNNQTAADVFLAVGQEANVRVLFDPDYQNRLLALNQTLDLRGATLEQALDYVALVTKSFWKPLSHDTIFVANDDPMRRSAYEEQITKAIYLTNAPVAQDVVDIANTVQRATDIKKLLVHPTQNVIIARADPDRVALAEKVIGDLDKPKAEIIIDVIILSVARNWARELGVQIFGLSKGSTNILFNPREVLNPATVAGRIGIPLSNLLKLDAGDYNVTLPGAALNMMLETRGTKLLDKAQLRTLEGQKSTLRIGQRIPYATGSFSPGTAGGTNPLINTQFQYFDVGLNIDVVAKVHEPDEVSLHIESDTSAVADRVDLGGVLQPVISQRKRVADVRVKEGEINFWDIVVQRQDVRVTSGMWGVSQIPVVGRFFSNENLQKSELQVLTLLIPHIIRAPDIRDINLAGLPSGSDQTVRLRYTTPEARKIAATSNDKVLELKPGIGMANMQQVGWPGMQPHGMMGMQPPGMMGMQPPGMGMQPPGMGPPVPPPGMGPPLPPPIGGMQPNLVPGGMQPGIPGNTQPGVNPMGGVPGATTQTGTLTGPGYPLPGPAPAGRAEITFQPPMQSAAVNANFTVSLHLQAADVAGGSITIQFDPQKLELTNVVAGPGASENNPASRAGGNVMLALSRGAGTGPLATLTFKAVSPGQTAVSVLPARLLNSSGAEILASPGGLRVEITGSQAAGSAPAGPKGAGL